MKPLGRLAHNRERREKASKIATEKLNHLEGHQPNSSARCLVPRLVVLSFSSFGIQEKIAKKKKTYKRANKECG
jgi:hypothetical protein